MDYHNSLWNPPAALVSLLKLTADENPEIRTKAQWQLAKAIETPLRKGVLFGDVVRNIFQAMPQGPGQMEWPLDILSPGREDEFVAYTSPGIGKIAERRVEGDYVTVPTYEITNTISWSLRYARDAGWPIIARCLEVLEGGMVKKINDDGWHVILTAAYDRNISVYDADASAGQFTKKLVSLMKTVMVRNGGGNTASMRQSALTDAFLSPESIEDVRNWGLDQVDELTRREIYVSGDDGPSVTRVFGVNLHPLREFGVGQEYQLFYTSKLGGNLEASDVELVIGVDMKNKDSFIMPVRQEPQVFPDGPESFRRGIDGYFTRGEMGFAVLDNRRVLSASY